MYNGNTSCSIDDILDRVRGGNHHPENYCIKTINPILLSYLKKRNIYIFRSDGTGNNKKITMGSQAYGSSFFWRYEP